MVKHAIQHELPLPWMAKQFANDPTPFEIFRSAKKNYSGTTRIDKNKGISLFDEDLIIEELDDVIRSLD